MKPAIFVFAWVGASLLTILPGPATATQPASPIQIGMSNSFVREQPKVFIDLAIGEFKIVMKNTTDLDGTLIVDHDPAEIADRLNGGKLGLAILYAHEVAWARKKYADLQPLLIAATKKKDKRALIIVHKDCPAKSVADLRGKKFDLPLRTKDYCRIYLDKLCAEQKLTAAKFFATIAKSASQVDALDAVARQRADATIIDTPWLDFYKEIKGPVFAKNLKVLQQSEVMPPAAIVYKPGVLAPATLDRIRAGLAKAHKDFRGQALMTLWHIDAFAAVPDDYAKSLSSILERYPVPKNDVAK